MQPVEENAQQEPQWPWFLTGVITFLSLQSMRVGRSLDTLAKAFPRVSFAVAEQCCGALRWDLQFKKKQEKIYL